MNYNHYGPNQLPSEIRNFSGKVRPENFTRSLGCLTRSLVKTSPPSGTNEAEIDGSSSPGVGPSVSIHGRANMTRSRLPADGVRSTYSSLTSCHLTPCRSMLTSATKAVSQRVSLPQRRYNTVWVASPRPHLSTIAHLRTVPIPKLVRTGTCSNNRASSYL